MRDRTGKVTVGETEYQIARFKPNVGTRILMRLIGAVVKAGEERASSIPEQTQQPEKKLSGQEMARAICSAAFITSLDDEFFDYVQKQSLALVMRVEPNAGPMPIVTPQGLLPEIADDYGLIMRLEMEVLSWNFSDFFEQGGMLGMMGMG